MDTDELIVLILSTRSSEYDDFKASIRKTWMNEFKLNGIKCFFYEGDENESFKEDTIYVNTKDDLKSTSAKLIRALELLINKYPNTKLIYRTNLSSFIDVNMFIKYVLNNKIGEHTYCGLKGNTTHFKELFYGIPILTKFFELVKIGPKIKFASGSGFFLGIKNVKILLEKRERLFYIDDVMVGYNLRRSTHCHNTPIRFDIAGNGAHKISREEFFQLQEKHLLFHYRFKTNDRNKDSKMLLYFKNYDYRLKECTF